MRRRSADTRTKRFSLPVLRQFASQFYYRRYVSFARALIGLLNFKNNWEIVSDEDIRKVRTSSTVFILGSGPSLARLTPRQIKEINKNDSIGISLSFLFDEITPTYHMLPLERESKENRGRARMLELFEEYRSIYSDTVMITPHTSLYRLGHPKWMPEAFPFNPKVHYMRVVRQDPLVGGEFTDEAFDRSLIYRGSLSVTLEFVARQEYSTIVLVGVDPSKWTYFFQDDPRLKSYLEETYKLGYGVPNGSGPESPYVNMLPRKGIERTIVEYLDAVREYLAKKRKIRLMTASNSGDLKAILPAYFSNKD